MDRQDYVNKSNQLLSQPADRAIPWDPINKIKTKLINILKRVKSQTGLDNNTYKVMYPTGCRAPKFYGFPKIHKQGTPLRAYSVQLWIGHLWCGQRTYQNAKILVGKSHHINSTHDFEQIKNETLLLGECLSSYDVSVLFTSVPVDSALGIIKDLLQKDPTLKERIVMSVGDIIILLEFCLKILTFLSKTSSMNRSRMWLWVPQ